MSRYVIEVGGHGCWTRDDLSGDPGRTLVLENASQYSKDDAVTRVETLKFMYPSRSYAMREIHFVLSPHCELL